MKWFLMIVAALGIFLAFFCKKKSKKKPATITIGELDKGTYGSEIAVQSGSLEDYWAE